jgi:hypothetical protein
MLCCIPFQYLKLLWIDCKTAPRKRPESWQTSTLALLMQIKDRRPNLISLLGLNKLRSLKETQKRAQESRVCLQASRTMEAYQRGSQTSGIPQIHPMPNSWVAGSEFHCLSAPKTKYRSHLCSEERMQCQLDLSFFSLISWVQYPWKRNLPIMQLYKLANKIS